MTLQAGTPALERDARGLLDADALGLALELRIWKLDAHLGETALVELPSPRRRRAGSRPPLALRRCGGFVVTLLVSIFSAVSCAEYLLDRLRLGQEPVERELRLGDIIKSLGLRDDEPTLEQVQLLEELVVADAKIRERALRACELAAQRLVLGREGGDARVRVGVLRARRVLHERSCMHARDRCPDRIRSLSRRRTSVHARTPRASWRRLRRRRELKAVEQRVERRLVDLDVRGVRDRRRR